MPVSQKDPLNDLAPRSRHPSQSQNPSSEPSQLSSSLSPTNRDSHEEARRNNSSVAQFTAQSLTEGLDPSNIAGTGSAFGREEETLAPSIESPSNLLDTCLFSASEGPDWDPSYGSFLDLAHIYEPQGQLIDEQRGLTQGADGQPQSTFAQDTFSAAPTFLAPTDTQIPPQGQPAVPEGPFGSSLETANTRRVTKRKPSEPETTRDSVRPRLASQPPDKNANEFARPTASDKGLRPVVNRMSSSTNSRSQSGSTSGPSGDREKNVYSEGRSSNPTPAPSMPIPGILKEPDPSERSKTCILPPEKVFPIQIGSELFRLSGASISSDAPSYFSHFFEEQLRNSEDGAAVRTLYIDRDPATFRDILKHLQGYYVRPRDGSHFVRLFADAQFYSLPRLISQLFESEIFVQIGEKHFQVPRDIFSGPGDSPNFFSLGFAIFGVNPGDVFPGLDRKGLLRPPAITPPVVINRSAEVFTDLLHMLRGYPVHIRNEEHRAELLRDCRYFHLRGLEQKLIPHSISYNLLRQKSEILIRLEDIRQSGVQFVSDVSPSDRAGSGGWVQYSRPFVDDTSHELIVEIGDESTFVDLNSMRADFHGLAKARIASLFQVVANKMNLPTNAPLGLLMKSGGAGKQPPSPGHTPLSEDRVKIRIDSDADITLDGEPYIVDWSGIRSALSTTSGETNFASGNRSQRSHLNTTPAPPDVNVDVTHQQAHLDKASTASDNTPQPLSVAGSVSNPNSPSPFPFSKPEAPRSQYGPAPAKRKRRDSLDEHGEWVVQRGQWRLRVQANAQESASGGMEIVFVAVKLHAVSGQRARNSSRGFLG
ncbi:hypothetical protein AJ79_05289 [Helicocarpus griseus UAMH5409]|uniref:Potassium channel tetramerisation-type BTB domain-containing protein n=1 Tax=Helicocarpus griseus UAMH5409 TaxID=1447875 RepID=A0A2B7XQ22_9EURO|nr:hypothetical protein AJ79_05289 [Helicocarpus griseus UAMH5409]